MKSVNEQIIVNYITRLCTARFIKPEVTRRKLAKAKRFSVMIPIVGDDCHYNPVRRRLVEGQAGENQKRKVNKWMESVSKVYCDERRNANNLSHPIAKLCSDLSTL